MVAVRYGGLGTNMSANNYWISYTNQGVLISRNQPDATEPFRARYSSPEIAGLVDQLQDEAYAADTPAGAVISWEALYALVDDRNYTSSLHLLRLPRISDLTLRLTSQGSLTDRNFRINFALVDAAHQPVAAMRGGAVQVGAELRLLSQPVWRLTQTIGAFNQRTDAERNDTFHRQQWGKIRRSAVDAKAQLGDFLRRTVVLTPEKLKLHLRKAEVGDTAVTEVQPTFEGAPENWLLAFDRADRVKERYDIATPEGVVQVLITPQIRTVLGEIKRMQGRRITGARAEAFLLNPYSALGPDATLVIDEDQVNEAKAAAGISFERFRPHIAINAAGFPFEVGIEIEEASGTCIPHVFRGDTELKNFVVDLARRLEGGRPIFGWQGYEFELQGDAHEHLAQLQAALEVRAKPPTIIRRDQIYDLSQYDPRVTDIGHDKPFISTYIVKRKDDDGWFPENLMVLLQVPGRDEVVPIPPEQFKEWEKELEAAESAGQTAIRLPGITETIPVSVARGIADRICGPLNSPEPPSPPAASETATSTAPKPPTLIIRGNIDALEHPEPAEPDCAAPLEMERPRALKPHIVLRAHQVEGVARMQQLFARSPGKCRGVLMADDMGLGKTVQLLTLIAWSFEKFSGLPPALVVAPVSLLENWRQEIERFFAADSLPVLTAYGDNLSALRVPRASIDAQLQGEGLVRFLRPGWRGNSCVVLTTYETLRDLEFSFAIEDWSIMVCDEAQRIKNPNAMITRAAKKQKVRFRIACTGTPVENSLADLWCLYDFVQPGFLGALNEFGREYGRPIEQWEEGGREKLGELRTKVEPLLIRRTKKDVAKDLPPKIEAPDCRVPLSAEQRGFYIGAFHLGGQMQRADGEPGRQNHLGILQRLRLICADPRPHGVEAFVREDLGDYRRKAPKMDWLLRRLEVIRGDQDKALIFAEHRDIQRLLQYYIAAHFGFRPDIINGDTAASAKSEASRQKRIDAFQARPGFGAIILSPLAVGFGVNIQAANHVIHFLRHWNPAKEDQATDRAYRIGQEKPVHVYCPLTVADDFKTFDVKLDELLRRKRELATDMLMGCGQLSSADFDIRDLVPPGAAEIRDAPITTDRLAAMDFNFFEAFVATLWRKQGYVVAVTPKSGDGGVDVIAIRGSEGTLIQCKSSGVEGKQLGWDAVKEVVGGTAKYEAQYPGIVFKRICATNQAFNPNAREQARINGVELLEREALVKLLELFPVTVLDVHNFRTL